MHSPAHGIRQGGEGTDSKKIPEIPWYSLFRSLGNLPPSIEILASCQSIVRAPHSAKARESGEFTEKLAVARETASERATAKIRRDRFARTASTARASMSGPGFRDRPGRLHERYLELSA